MRFFADPCVLESVAEALEADGHEVVRLRVQMRTDAPGPEVIAEAQRLDAILLSLNGDFSDIVSYPPRAYHGIVSLQVKGRPEVLVQVVSRLIDYMKAHPKPEYYRSKLLLGEVHRIRIRGGNAT